MLDKNTATLTREQAGDDNLPPVQRMANARKASHTSRMLSVLDTMPILGVVGTMPILSQVNESIPGWHQYQVNTESLHKTSETIAAPAKLLRTRVGHRRDPDISQICKPLVYSQNKAA